MQQVSFKFLQNFRDFLCRERLFLIFFLVGYVEEIYEDELDEECIRELFRNTKHRPGHIVNFRDRVSFIFVLQLFTLAIDANTFLVQC